MGQAVISPYEQALERLEQTGHYTCFEYLGVSVGFYSDEPQGPTTLGERFAGYFEETDNKRPDAVVYSSKDSALFTRLYDSIADEISTDKEYTEQPMDEARSLIFDSELSKKVRDEKICYVLDRPNRSTLISYPGLEKSRRSLEQRVARNVVKLLLLEKGWLPLHAAALEKHDVGVCIVGGKLAGKTSTLINLLSSPGAKLVANDKVFVRDTGSSIEGCGFPNKAGIRVGTLLANPRLQLWMERATDSFYAQISPEELRELAASTPIEEIHSRKEKITLMPLDMVELFDISIAATTPVRAFVSVQFEADLEDARMRELQGDEAVATVMEHFRPLADERQKFLHTYFTFTDDELHDGLVSLLRKYSSVISVQELTQSARTNAQSIALVDDLARQMHRKPVPA